MFEPSATTIELLAPAGNEECLYAAIENGADAVYFGLAGTKNDTVFNARTRAKNIPLENLEATMCWLHRQGKKGYVTLNTLVHGDELPAVEDLLRQIATAQADAIIVQDFGVAKLARCFCPDLPLHASTQMSLTSRLAIELACDLGFSRVILPRELTLEQIQRLADAIGPRVPLEVFCHGALCMSFSGQCYASLALGGRSANRGRCAQPCRLSYGLRDAQTGEHLADGKQLLSPCDLASLPLLPKLIETGVAALKIEGRLKPPEYVAEVTKIYRDAIDFHTKNAAIVKNATGIPTQERPIAYPKRLEETFSRGFSTGWLEGVNPRQLVPGNIQSHRGSELGKVIEVRRDAAVVLLSAPVKRGDGVLFENLEQPENSQGGRVYEMIRHRESVKTADAGAKVLLTFANHSIDERCVHAGQMVRKTDDPHREREIRKTLENYRKDIDKNNAAKIPVTLRVRAKTGEPLFVTVSVQNNTRHCQNFESDSPLEAAKKHALTQEVLREQLGRLGGTRYFLHDINAAIENSPMIPLSVLGGLRKKIIAWLDAQNVETDTAKSPQPQIVFGKSLADLRAKISSAQTATERQSLFTKPVLHLQLDRIDFFQNEKLLHEILDTGLRSFYGEFRDLVDYRHAAHVVQKTGAEFVAVLPRMIKPGETSLVKKILNARPNGILARNLEELRLAKEHDISAIADFSFNVVNDLSFQQTLDWGAARITLGWDIAPRQQEELLRTIPAQRVEQILVGRIPLFCSEHCFWRASSLTKGLDRKNCGRVCRTMPLQICDRKGALHWVRSDLFCRNIVENSEPLSAVKPLPGVNHFRVIWDDRLGDASPLDTLHKVAYLIHAYRNGSDNPAA